MHELSVTQGVLDVVLERAKEANCGKITAINLVVGDMASIVDDCVQFYFDFGGCSLLSSSAHAVKMS
jgi:hydrogenase nickel incorporation protein HypA/HybF